MASPVNNERAKVSVARTCADFLLQLVPSPAFSVFTPRSVGSPTPGLDFAARSPRSLTLGLSIIDPQPHSPSDLLAAVAEEGTIFNEGMCQSPSTRVSQRDVENVVIVNDLLKTSITNVLTEEPATTTDLFEGTPMASEPSAEVATTVGDDVHRPSPSAASPTTAEQTTESTQETVERVHQADRRFLSPKGHAHTSYQYYSPLEHTWTWMWSCVRDISIWFYSAA
jgi:hypothetical protein